MIGDWLFIATLVSALGSGLMAGVFFAFSTFVMRALGAIPPAQGIAAMQSINVVVLTPAFLTVFVGTAALSAVLGVSALRTWPMPGAAYLLAASLFYVVGTFLVTMVFNVPRNEALAAVDAASVEGARLWADYLRGWTAWNHVRTAAALGAAAMFTIGLCLRSHA